MPEINDAVVALDIALAAAEVAGIIETAPSYRSLLVCYEPTEVSFEQLVTELRRLLLRGTRAGQRNTAAWNVPVVYDGPFAPDLGEVAERLGLTSEQVITAHVQADYLVYMVGFAPGLPYLGGLPPALHISRRLNPRPRVPAGAVMIGGTQANIVPMAVPSAWYILGQTPLRAFDLNREDPFLFRSGDRVRFHRIDAAEYDRLAGMTSEQLLPIVRAAA